ncbi:MAG TPA: HAMP domain-containing sensor histidine kinase, partial [Longimicrobium sp.]|nr:HAMP domain-containing sensor histidine kinase [Longimicrobium sp.]
MSGGHAARPADGSRTTKLDAATELLELRSRLADAEHAAESRARVVGHVAHEFRTPLSSILGFASLLADEDDLTGERRDEYLGIILRNARHLLHVVNDILNLSKVEAGTLEVTLGAVSAGEVAEAVADSLRTVAGERAITLRLTDDAPRMVRADAGRLRQVLLNLMDNAIKYSPRGSAVEVVVRGDDRAVCVEVTDHGPGVSDDDQTR